MSREEDRRRGISLTAKDLVKATKGKMSYEDARIRVTKAKNRGDMIRNNNNK